MKNKGKIKLIFGLGNPGSIYKNTPHNFGRDLIEYYIEKISNKEITGKFFISKKYNSIFLAIPKIYMNENGKALKEVLNKFKINTENVLIIHDEADLPFLKIKISFNGGSSMHKGVESIYKECGQKIWRLRIGIQYLKERVKAEKLILKKLPKSLILKWNKAKKSFYYVIEKLDKNTIEKLNLPNNFFIDNQFL